MAQRPRLPHVTCPACGGRAFARGSGKASTFYRELYFHCRNPDTCGHEFVVAMEAVRTIKPSKFPGGQNVLPLTTWNAGAPGNPANDDDGPPGEPVATALAT